MDKLCGYLHTEWTSLEEAMSMLSHAEELVVWSAWSAGGINGQNGHFMGQRCLSALIIVFHVLCWIRSLGRRVDGWVWVLLGHQKEKPCAWRGKKEKTHTYAWIDSIAIVHLIFYVLFLWLSGLPLAKNPPQMCSTPDKNLEWEWGPKEAAAGSGLGMVNHNSHSY